MRIRKHAKISPLHYYSSSLFIQQHGAVLQTHVCQLNQSPWDVITFPIQDDNIINHQTLLPPPPPPPPAPSSSSSHKLDVYDSCAVNGTFYDSEQSSITTMKLEMNDSEMNYSDNNNIIANVPADSGDFEKNEENDNITTMCCKNDGKGWQCSRESKRGHNLCERHFAQKHYSSSSSNNSSHSTTITAAAANSGTKINVTTAAAETTHSSRGRPHRPKKSSSSEFYYYSGFGPLWGKKRGLSTEKSTQSSSSQMDNEVFDYIEYDNDDDEVEKGKMKIKKARKPIKARSLKSLM